MSIIGLPIKPQPTEHFGECSLRRRRCCTPPVLTNQEQADCDGAPHLSDIGVFGGLRLLVDGDVVAGHALLGDEHLLAAVHDEVAALHSRATPLCSYRRRANHPGMPCMLFITQRAEGAVSVLRHT